MSEDRTLPGHLGGSQPAPPTDPAGIGGYRLIEKIGEGGMGEVWRAEQLQPVQRIVALKLIKPGLDTRGVIARFESERQTLALMEHPAIARVYDAGTTDRGHPYFVMEHVDGVPIDDYCERRALGMRERLQLFVRVCHGVQHAHQRGIIHRDIKPSNILVTEHDGAAVPKIIDFGVAKATTGTDPERTALTRAEAMLGTPEYMSPEQAELSSHDVDSRSDVYSLGVLLYKLLVGQLPFDIDKAFEAGLDEVRRTIREQEPRRPSTRVTQLETGATSAAGRHVERTTLARNLRGDLDWVTMRALEKDRERRYPSVSELAGDVERHLAHRPVLAGPPGAAYRMTKFVRRHRTAVGAGALIALAMIAGTTAATVGFVRARNAESVAVEQALRANLEAQTANEITTFLLGLFRLADPASPRGNEITVREVLDRGVQQIRTGLQDRPVLRARLLDTMGDVYLSLALHARAEPLLRDAYRIRRDLYGESGPEVAPSLNSLGRHAFLTADFERALGLTQQALDIQQAHLDPNDPELARTLNNLGNVQWRLRDYAGARQNYERALEIRSAVLAPNHPDIGHTMHALGIVLGALGDGDQARRHLQQALTIQENVLGADHPDLARTIVSLAGLLKETGEYETARGLYERAAAIQLRAYGPDHPLLAGTWNGLADLLRRTGDHAGSREWLERVLALRIATYGAENEIVAATLWQLAGAHRELNDLAGAEQFYRRSLSIRAGVLDEAELAYDEACYHAVMGHRDQALLALQRSAAAGFAPERLARLLEGDSDLASLRGVPEFESLRARLEE